MPENISRTISPLPGFVPQIFFDLIARVAPGAFLLLCAYFLVFNDPQHFIADLNKVIARFKQEEGAKTILFLGFLFMSYIIALILEGIYRIIKKVFYNKWKDCLGRQIESTDKEALEYINKQCPKSVIITKDIFPDIFIMYDSIRLLSPPTGSRLVKLRAEYYMIRVIVIGLSFLSIINLFPIISRSRLSEFTSETVLIFLIVIFSFIFFQRRKTFLWGVYNHWVILKEKDIFERYCI